VLQLYGHYWNGTLQSQIACVFASVAISGCAFGGMEAPDRGRLLSSAGVSQVEGASGAGLSNWATITGYGSRDSYGATAFSSHVELEGFDMQASGAAVGIKNRVELSYAHQSFDLRDGGVADGLRPGFKLNQNIIGAKVRLVGDVIYDQDTFLPQISVGAQYKTSGDEAEVLAMGADSASGVDVYVTATKAYLDKSLLLSASLRGTRANQLGLLGFGGENNSMVPQQITVSIVSRRRYGANR